MPRSDHTDEVAGTIAFASRDVDAPGIASGGRAQVREHAVLAIDPSGKLTATWRLLSRAIESASPG
jgi:hypothetical protein